MAIDEKLAARLRAAFEGVDGVNERKMFGGLAFMLHGNMCCGVTGMGDLMVRVGADRHEECLALPNARPMDFTGRPMKSMVFVDFAALTDEAALQEWVERGIAYALTLPPK